MSSRASEASRGISYPVREASRGGPRFGSPGALAPNAARFTDRQLSDGTPCTAAAKRLSRSEADATNPGGLRNKLGRLSTDRVINGSTSPLKFTINPLRQTAFAYNARGKVLSSQNQAGALDALTAAYTGYLLGNVPGKEGKGGIFAGALGFDKATLEPALRTHFMENLTTGTFKNGNFEVVGDMLGANGRSMPITSVWRQGSDGTWNFVTAYPKK